MQLFEICDTAQPNAIWKSVVGADDLLVVPPAGHPSWLRIVMARCCRRAGGPPCPRAGVARWRGCPAAGGSSR